MYHIPILRVAEEADVAKARLIYNRYVRESTATFHCRIQSEEDFRKKFLLPLPHGAIVAIDPQHHRLLGYVLLSPFIDRCAQKGMLPHGRASRIVSRLSRFVNALAA